MKNSIYLDHAAATQLDDEVLEQMLPYLKDDFYNPSAIYLKAKKVRRDIESARSRVAKTIGIRPREVIFTSGATEANNLAISGVMKKFPEAKLLVSSVEHSSVLEPAKQYKHSLIPVDRTGQIDVTDLKKMITDDVVLISVMQANNEVGTLQPLISAKHLIIEEKHRRLLAGNNLPLYLHTDAAQAPNLLPINPKKMGVDLMSLNGGKIYGPKQSGILYVATGINLEPLIFGGGQEFGLRSGTENVAGIVGFSFALEKAVKMRSTEEKRMSDLAKLFYEEINTKIPKAIITNQTLVLHNIIHVVFPGTDNERLMMELDEAGIMCAVGSACSASSDEPSHVLKAMGFSDDQAQSSLRFSMGRETTEEHVKFTVKTLSKLLA